MNTNELISKINDDIRYQEEYYTHNLDNAYADYVSWGWTEGDAEQLLKDAMTELDDDELDDLVEYLLRNKMTEREVFRLLGDIGGIESTCGYSSATNSIFHVVMGETECPFSDDIISELEKLSDDDRELVLKDADAYVKGDYFYLNLDGEGWSLVVEPDAAIDALLNGLV